jgi:hypothetical protein
VPVSNVKTRHPDYEDFVDSWLIMRDTVDGEDKVKDKGQTYLPMKSAVKAMTDLNLQASTYLSYQARAEFPEIVGPTITGSGGLITDQAPGFDLPTQMEYLLENCDGTGSTLEVFHKKLVTEVLTTGRFGVLPGPLADGTFVLTGYKAERIINWDHDDQGRVNFVVLDESDQRRDPVSNVWSMKERFLELSLDESGNYVAFRSDGNTTDPDPIVAMKPDRTTLKAVPFVFINTLGLQAEPDDVPLYGLAKIALRIYRLDADYMQGLHMTSEPTPYITGFDDAKGAIERGEVPKTIGAANLWILPKSATAGFLEFQGAGLEAQSKAILASLERAVVFGAQVLSEKTAPGSESGTSREMRMHGQQSLLRNIAKTTAAGLERALRNIAVWMGLDEKKVVVRPFLDFVDFTLSPQELTALVAGWQSGAYSKRTLFENMQRADMIPKERTFEDEEELIGTEGVPLGGLTDPNADPGNDPGNDNPDNKPKPTAPGD